MKIPCDNCGYYINESDHEDVQAIRFKIENETYYFCCEKCYEDFLKENTEEIYILPNGVVDDE